VLAIGLIAGLAIALGFILGSIFNREDGETAGGSPSAGSSASAPASESASIAPSAAASASASAAPAASAPAPVVAAPGGLIPPGSIVRVLTDGLRMREQPSTESTLVDNLPVDQLLLVGFAAQQPDWGPISAEGFAWYPVVRLGEQTDLPPLSDGPLLTNSAAGWVAAGDDAEAFVQLLDPRCPPRPVSLATLEAMQPWEQLACFGPEQITLEGTFGCGGCVGTVAGTFEPDWLAQPFPFGYLSVDPNARIGPFTMRFAPDGPATPAVGQILRVVGHFDDPAAAGCAVAPGDPPVPLDSLATALYCREQFVVESIEVTGTDPDFP
jgi:hypothetical protein